jgi:hypothetical protein
LVSRAQARAKKYASEAKDQMRKRQAKKQAGAVEDMNQKDDCWYWLVDNSCKVPQVIPVSPWVRWRDAQGAAK